MGEKIGLRTDQHRFVVDRNKLVEKKKKKSTVQFKTKNLTPPNPFSPFLPNNTLQKWMQIITIDPIPFPCYGWCALNHSLSLSLDCLWREESWDALHDLVLGAFQALVKLFLKKLACKLILVKVGLKWNNLFLNFFIFFYKRLVGYFYMLSYSCL